MKNKIETNNHTDFYKLQAHSKFIGKYVCTYDVEWKWKELLGTYLAVGSTYVCVRNRLVNWI